MSRASLLLAIVVAALASTAPLVARTPAVYFSDAEIDAARDRAERHPWADAALGAIVAAADAWIAAPVPLPTGPTGWFHDYYCPEHGVRLQYDAKRPHEHVCPEDGKALRGPKLDAYWVAATIRQRLQAGVRCGLAWRFTGNAKYERSAAEILTNSARHYRDHVNVEGRKKRRWMWQSLDEAVYILEAVRCYELIAPGDALSRDDRTLIENDYLRPTAVFLRGERRTIHNIHSWYNAAILAIGMVITDRDLVDFAIGGTKASRHGLRDQLREGVSSEGFWREGSLGYHYYTLSSLAAQLVPAKRLDVDLSAEFAIVRRMYRAPLSMADRQLVIPPTNDSHPGSLDRYAVYYEVACGLFPDDAALAGFLTTAYRASGRERDTIQALFRGPETLVAAESPTLESRNFPDSGFAILRGTPANRSLGEVYVLLDHGPHGGGHGHPDKLSVSLHALQRVLALDTGTAGYGMALNSRWYRQTLSHNTVVVDRRSQRATTGKLLSFRADGPVRHAIASADTANPGVRWQRGVFAADEGWVVILDRLAASKESTFDWAWHGFGELSVQGATLAPVTKRDVFGTRNGYDAPDEVRHGTTAHDVVATWTVRDDTRTLPSWRSPRTTGEVHLRCIGERGSEVFTGVGPGNPARDRVPLIVVRRTDSEALFRVLIEIVSSGASSAVRSVKPVDGGLQVQTTTGTKTVRLP